MDPKSRDSQGRAVLAGKVLFTAALAAFAAACDVSSEESVSADETTESTTSESALRVRPSLTLTRAMSLQTVDAAAARVIGGFAPAGTGDDASDTTDDDAPNDDAPADGGADDDVKDDGAAADDGAGDDPADDGAGDDPADDGPSCAEGADVSAPLATGLVFTIAATETGMEPVSPGDCVQVVDDCDADPIVELLWVTSDEPESGVALDDRSPDVTDLGCGLGVRAERAAGGDGRVYTVGFRATDRSGNATQGTCSVVVEAEAGVTPVDSGEVYEADLRGLGCP